MLISLHIAECEIFYLKDAIYEVRELHLNNVNL